MSKTGESDKAGAGSGAESVQQPQPSPDRWGVLWRIAVALCLGTLGGSVFLVLTMPLPWMLGAMTFNTVAAVAKAPVLPPMRVRPYVVTILGVMLGSGFTPDILDQAGAWLLSFSFLFVYLAACGLLVVPFYKKVGGFDNVTAYFSGMPGGLNEMLLIGKEMGGDDRRIALAHASRILVVVCLIAFWFRFVAGYELGDRSQFGVPFAEIPAGELVILAVCALVGFFGAKRLRLPAPHLLGPMLVSALVHVTGIVHSPPPNELVIVAQIVLGTVIGCRFLGSPARAVGRALLLSFGASVIMLAVTAGFAVGFHGLFQQTAEQVLLAYSPGGLAEMSLVALAMNAEVAYVASHHMVRIIMVIIAAPLAFTLLRRLGGLKIDQGPEDREN